MGSLTYILVLFLALGTSGVDVNKCATGCAPTWNTHHPLLIDVERIEGDDVDFQCRVLGNPLPEVGWTKDEKFLVNSTLAKKMTIGTDNIHLTDLIPQDTGTYTCFAENKFGSIEWSVALTVYEKDADELNGPANKTAYTNQTIYFWCKVDVNATDATITWIHDVMINMTLTGEVRVIKQGVYKDYGQLVLPRVAVTDFGRYTCIVNTTRTSTRRSAWLTPFSNSGEGHHNNGATKVASSTLTYYLKNLGIVVGVISGFVVVLVLTMSARTLYYNWRKIRGGNSGAKRLDEDMVGYQEM